MDIFFPVVIFFIAFGILFVCGWCCKRKREGTVYGRGRSNIIVTTQPVPTGPYVAPHAPGFVPHNPPYPVHNPHPAAPGITPYPPAGPSGAPLPYPPGIGASPYPEYAVQAQPPSYSEAISQPPIQHLPMPMPMTNKEGYAKQAPYNPHY